MLGVPNAAGFTPHAMVWTGTAASAVDLNNVLPSSFGASANSTANSIDAAGDVFGFAQDSSNQYHSVAWLSVRARRQRRPSPVVRIRMRCSRAEAQSPATSTSVSTPRPAERFSNTNSLTTQAILSGQILAPFQFCPAHDRRPRSGMGLVLRRYVYRPGRPQLPLRFEAPCCHRTPSTLQIEHFVNGQWVTLPGVVDPINDFITITTDSFSPFVLAASPRADRLCPAIGCRWNDDSTTSRAGPCDSFSPAMRCESAENGTGPFHSHAPRYLAIVRIDQFNNWTSSRFLAPVVGTMIRRRHAWGYATRFRGQRGRQTHALFTSFQQRLSGLLRAAWADKK